MRAARPIGRVYGVLSRRPVGRRPFDGCVWELGSREYEFEFGFSLSLNFR
jgi:hypothetical protein